MEFCWELGFVRGDDDEEEREEAVSGVVGAADAHSAGEECCSKSELSQQQLRGNPSGRTTGGCCAVVFELQTALPTVAVAVPTIHRGEVRIRLSMLKHGSIVRFSSQN